MRHPVLSFLFIGTALTGCSADPVAIPNDFNEAAQLCIAAKGLVARDDTGRKKGDPHRLSKMADLHAYAMIAASRDPDFDFETLYVSEEKIATYGQRIMATDYRTLAGECDVHFGIRGELAIPVLPEDDVDALYSCLAVSATMNGFIHGQGIDSEGRDKHYRALWTSLAAEFQAATGQGIRSISASDPKAEARLREGLKHGFSQGNAITYLAACEARFKDR